jgi:hypothetical protein
MEKGDAIVIRYFSHRAGLRVEVHGLGTYENTVTYWRDIVAELRKRKVPGLLLIDETTGAPLTAQEWRHLVAAMVGKGLEHVRIAHVKPSGLQRIEYCELSAREAGLEARVFTNEAEADLWLRYGEHTRST